MASLAGVPLTAGFLGKFLVFKVAFESQQFLLIVVAIITVGCGFYYYLKVVRAMYWQTTTGNQTTIPISLLSTITIGALVVLIFLFGIFPQLGAGLLS
jgi:NADH-quinone oxidoreductase subunit N